jgi:hypothetical protein
MNRGLTSDTQPRQRTTLVPRHSRAYSASQCPMLIRPILRGRGSCGRRAARGGVGGSVRSGGRCHVACSRTGRTSHSRKDNFSFSDGVQEASGASGGRLDGIWVASGAGVWGASRRRLEKIALRCDAFAAAGAIPALVQLLASDSRDVSQLGRRVRHASGQRLGGVWLTSKCSLHRCKQERKNAKAGVKNCYERQEGGQTTNVGPRAKEPPQLVPVG